MAIQIEEPRRRRVSQPDDTAYTRMITATWSAANPQTIAANLDRVSCAIMLEVGDGGSVRVATGGVTASATVGALLDATTGPFVKITENVGAISIYAVVGTESVTVEDDLIEDGSYR